MFTGVSCFKKSGHHDLYKFRLLCHNGREKGFRRRSAKRSFGGLTKAMKQNGMESKTMNSREKAQESQMGISVLAPFRGHVIYIQSGFVTVRQSQSQ
jgi:hypothetical protein